VKKDVLPRQIGQFSPQTKVQGGHRLRFQKMHVAELGIW